jgi:hypothetical protein
MLGWFRSLPLLLLVCVFGSGAKGQDVHDWQSVAQLHTGDKVRLTLRTGPTTEGVFQNWTPQQVIVGTVTATKQDVLKIEQHLPSGKSRAKWAAAGAIVGFGVGFGIGAALTGCRQSQFGPCVSRTKGGAATGAAGAVIGASIGALVPHHPKKLIYSAS